MSCRVPNSGEARAKLIKFTQTCHEDQIKVGMMDHEEHGKHTLQIHNQQKGDTLIQDEKRKLAMIVDELERESQQHSTHLYSFAPTHG